MQQGFLGENHNLWVFVKLGIRKFGRGSKTNRVGAQVVIQKKKGYGRPEMRKLELNPTLPSDRFEYFLNTSLWQHQTGSRGIG